LKIFKELNALETKNKTKEIKTKVVKSKVQKYKYEEYSRPPDKNKRNKNEELTKCDLILIAITNLMLIFQIGLIETIKLY
jgi:hypothetical protein